MEVRMADERVDRLRAAGHPFSIIGRTEMNDGVSYVDFDFAGAVGRAVDHLYELGHRRMALLNRAPALSMPDYGPTVRSRTGFEHATAELSVEGDHLLTGTSGRHYIEVLRYLERNPDCTAAITVSVTYAPLLAALRDLGRRVPEDFSVVAIIASQIVDLVIPPLTTIELPAFEMGRLGGEILIRQLADPERPPAQVLLEGPLQVRSSAPPPRRHR
jgi:DNA-binding LacI/PurR family transcriptional regulator